jgi:hypothetical protein
LRGSAKSWIHAHFASRPKHVFSPEEKVSISSRQSLIYPPRDRLPSKLTPA